MHTGNIDTLEILSPFTKTNIFMNSYLFSCVDKRVTQKDVSVTHISENCITYFCSSGDLLPARPYTNSNQSHVSQTYNITLSKFKEIEISLIIKRPR